MDNSNIKPIGNLFKKENIFLATVNSNKIVSKQVLKEKKMKYIPKIFIDKLVDSGIISFQEFDIFYLGENGYTRFTNEGPETFKGDDSDGKGLIDNVVSAWEYYNEEELREEKINDSFFAIVATTIEPLKKYNNDYNSSRITTMVETDNNKKLVKCPIGKKSENQQ